MMATNIYRNTSIWILFVKHCMLDRDSEISVKFMILYIYMVHVVVLHVLWALLGFALDRNLDIKH